MVLFNALGLSLMILHNVCGRDEASSVTELLMQHATSSLLQIDTRLPTTPYSTRFARLAGSSHAEISAKINEHAAVHPSVQSVLPCAELNSHDVSLLALELKKSVDENIRISLPEHDGRQVFLKPWEFTGNNKLTSHAVRDALCAETMKLWAHHIPNYAKNTSMKFTLPSLPVVTDDMRANMSKELSCADGHSIIVDAIGDDGDEELDWPHWPKIVHFTETGHGPYPFWQYGPYDKLFSVDLPMDTPGLYLGGSELEVWHNTYRQVTAFYHPSCEWDWAGFGQFGKDACMALQMGGWAPNGTWYLFTANKDTKTADERFCCLSDLYHKGSGNSLGTINRQFMDKMTYFGEVEFHGDYYDGPAKRYAMAMQYNIHCAECDDAPRFPLTVFYETDMQDKPLRFGEYEYGVDFQSVERLSDMSVPLIYNDMNPNSFTMSGDWDAYLAVPNICKNTTLECRPGRSGRPLEVDP